jgi:uncharacterized protein YjbI with pentapeptide repeats
MNYQRIQRLIFRATDTKQQVRQRRKLRKWVGIVGIVGIVVAVLVVGRFILFKVKGNPFQFPMNARNWTGFGESYDNNVSEVAEKGTETDGKTTKKTDKIITTQKKLQPAKTLWDWMGLLLAPATLAGLGFLFQYSQEKAKRDKEEADKKRDADQQREQALQAYFEQLSILLVDKRLLKLHDVEETEIDADAALNVVKAKTLALFRLFDNADPTDMPRKASVLAFLGDTGLLEAMSQILDLSGSHWEKANLRRANLSGAKLIGANLRLVNLSDANLSDADLSDANLSDADLSDANLTDAILHNADLRGADLWSVHFRGADLSRANLSDNRIGHAYLSGVELCGAYLSGADLSDANLSDANLGDADLSRANLSDADLSGADLSRANLSDANLKGAKLSSAKLSDADLSRANLSDADLSSADLSCVKLIDANLKGAQLSSVILLRTDFTRTKGLVQQQLEGDDPPLLCNVTLPKGIAVDPNRDCKRLPEVLLRRYHKNFNDLEHAQKYVDKYSNH